MGYNPLLHGFCQMDQDEGSVSNAPKVGIDKVDTKVLGLDHT